MSSVLIAVTSALFWQQWKILHDSTTIFNRIHTHHMSALLSEIDFIVNISQRYHAILLGTTSTHNDYFASAWLQNHFLVLCRPLDAFFTEVGSRFGRHSKWIQAISPLEISTQYTKVRYVIYLCSSCFQWGNLKFIHVLHITDSWPSLEIVCGLLSWMFYLVLRHLPFYLMLSFRQTST